MGHGNNQTRSAIPQAAWCQLNRGRIRRLLGSYGDKCALIVFLRWIGGNGDMRSAALKVILLRVVQLRNADINSVHITVNDILA